MNNELDFKKYLDLLNRHKTMFAVTALAVMAVAVVLCYVLPKKYEATSTIFIEKNVITDLVKGIAVTPSMDDAIKVLKYAITSRTLVQKVVDELGPASRAGSDLDRETYLAGIRENIDVKVQEDNNLFIISFKDGDPRFARDFVNTLVQRYIEENVSSKREESYGAIKFLSEQLGTYKEKLDKAEADLNQFKSQQGGVINIDEAKLLEEINISQQKLYDIQLRRRQLEGLRPVIIKAADPLQMKLVALQKQLEELRVSYTDSYPEVIRVKSEIETLRHLLKSRKADAAIVDSQELDKTEAELNALKISEAGMKRYIAANQALLKRIPTAKTGLEKLELEKQNRKELYDQLMARHGQSEVSKQMEVQDKTTNFRIVDPAVMPMKPVSPNRVLIILMGVAAGLGAGFGLLVAIDRFDPAIRDLDALKGIGLQVMAVIPRITVAEELQQQRRQDLKLYRVAGCCFAVILLILATEALNLSLVDRVANLLGR